MLTHVQSVIIKPHSKAQYLLIFSFLCARFLSFFHLKRNSDTFAFGTSIPDSAKFSDCEWWNGV